jgi:SAM-dependent methyltransferase
VDDPYGDAIAAHYDHFPYPTVRCVVPSGPPEHVAGTLSFLLRRRASDALSPRGSIWIAGCGTTQAAQWGLTFPDADILATDVSARTLEIAERLVREVGATNVRFEHRDLRRMDDERRFDFVFCTGVAHHLVDPAAGLRSVRDALAPNGAALVMVYSRVHREALGPVRRALEILGTEPGEDPYEVACRALAAAFGERCTPAHGSLLRDLYALRERDRSFLADLLVNPRETSYDLASLAQLWKDAGLRFVEWKHPGAWRLRQYVDDPVLIARAEALGPEREAALVYELAGLGSPMLDVLVERDDAPERAPYTTEDLLAMRMLARSEERQLDIEDGRVTTVHHIAPYEVQNGLVGGIARGGHGSVRHWAIHQDSLPFIQACDGTRTTAELCEQFERFAPREQLLAMILDLSPRDVGLLAPV